MPRKTKQEMREEYLRKLADLDTKEKESDAKEATTLVADIAKIDEQIGKLNVRKDGKVSRLHELAEKGVTPGTPVAKPATVTTKDKAVKAESDVDAVA
jgi:hypothetical protein